MHKELLKAHFLNMYMIALSDFDFAEEEMKLIKELGENLGLTEEEMQNLMMNPDFVTFTVPNDFETKVKFLYDYAKIIWADGIVKDDERDLLKKFIRKFGLDKEEQIMETLLKDSETNLRLEKAIEHIHKLLN